MENLIHLDTHVVLWLYSGETRLLSKKACELIEESTLCISPIVELELEYLKEIKRITVAPEKILKALKMEIGLSFCSHSFEIVVTEACNLKWTRDPFDRIITASASINNITLITKDFTILENYKYAVWE